MKARMLVAVFAAISLGAGSIAPSFAETEAKPLTPQQQKMKDCAAKWKQEKAQKHVHGREAYKAFMKTCLKD